MTLPGAPTAAAEAPKELAAQAKTPSAAPAASQGRPCQARVDRKASRQLVLRARPALQFGKVGEAAGDGVKGEFNLDRSTVVLSNAAPAAPAGFASLDLGRFDGFGREWTVRIAVDAHTDGSHFQYTFYRPTAAQMLLPSVAGSNWLGQLTYTQVDWLVTSTTSGATNTTWLPAAPWDAVGPEAFVTFGMRVAALIGGGDCMSPTGQTQLCHAPGGTMWGGVGYIGTYTAAFGQGDGVAHNHGRRATYWIKDVNIAGTP